MDSAATSLSMWAASESSANEPVSQPAVASMSRKPPLSQSAIVKARRAAALPGGGAWLWWSWGMELRQQAGNMKVLSC